MSLETKSSGDLTVEQAPVASWRPTLDSYRRTLLAFIPALDEMGLRLDAPKDSNERLILKGSKEGLRKFRITKRALYGNNKPNRELLISTCGYSEELADQIIHVNGIKGLASYRQRLAENPRYLAPVESATLTRISCELEGKMTDKPQVDEIKTSSLPEAQQDVPIYLDLYPEAEAPLPNTDRDALTESNPLFQTEKTAPWQNSDVVINPISPEHNPELPSQEGLYILDSTQPTPLVTENKDFILPSEATHAQTIMFLVGHVIELTNTLQEVTTDRDLAQKTSAELRVMLSELQDETDVKLQSLRAEVGMLAVQLENEREDNKWLMDGIAGIVGKKTNQEEFADKSIPSIGETRHISLAERIARVTGAAATILSPMLAAAAQTNSPVQVRYLDFPTSSQQTLTMLPDQEPERPFISLPQQVTGSLTIDTFREVVTRQGYDPTVGELLFAKMITTAKPEGYPEKYLRYKSVKDVVKAFWNIELSGDKSYLAADAFKMHSDKFKQLSLSSDEIKKIAHLLPNGAIVVFSPNGSALNMIDGEAVGYVGVLGMRATGEPIIVDEKIRNRADVFKQMEGSIVQVFLPIAEPTRFVSIADGQEQMTDEDLSTYLLQIYGDKLNSVNAITDWKNYPTEQYKKEFLLELIAMSKRLNPNNPYLANQIAAAMLFESGFRPDAMNPWSSATGLIQFMIYPDGLTRPEFAAMKPIEQLEYVEMYLQNKGELNTIFDVYMAILWPAAVGKDPEFVIMRQGDGIYEVNPVDQNGDGETTVKEAATAVIEPSIKAGEKLENLIPIELAESGIIQPDKVYFGLSADEVPTTHKGEELVKAADYENAIEEQFGWTYSGFTTEEMRWYWEMMWGLSNTNIIEKQKGMLVEKSNKSKQVGRLHIQLIGYANKEVATSVGRHELGHDFMNYFVGFDIIRQVIARSGPISYAGSGAIPFKYDGMTAEESILSEEMAELFAYTTGAEVPAYGDPSTFINPFHGKKGNMYPEVWAFFVRLLELKGDPALEAIQQSDRTASSVITGGVFYPSDPENKFGVTEWSIANSRYYVLKKPVVGIEAGIHPGIDIPMKENTKLYSAISGTVVEAGWNEAWGNYLVVQSGSVKVRYMHMNDLSVQRNQVVDTGDFVGLSGATGSASEGAHLHVDVKNVHENHPEYGQFINPMRIIDFTK